MTLLSGSALTDLWKNKIYNAWILPGMLMGLVISTYQGGAGGLLTAILSVLVSLGILLPVYFLKGIGAGDVKLFAAVAAFLPVQAVITCIICSFLIGGVISVFVVLTKRNIRQTIHFAVPILISVLFYVEGTI
jgi:prepilin peptidase CpaA